MKSVIRLYFKHLVSFCSAGLMLASVATAQTVVIGAQSDVTLAITLSVTSDVAFKVSGVNKQYSGTILATAFNNVFFLNQLRLSGLIPDNVVTGWKLVMVNRSPLTGNLTDHNRAFYLVKTAKTPVLITSDILRLVSLPGYAESYSNLTNISQTTVSGTTSFRTTMAIEGRIPGLTQGFTARGIFTASDKSGPVIFSAVTYPFLYQLVSGRIAGLCGSATADNDPNPQRNNFLVEGAVSFSAEIPVNIAMYPAP